VQVLLGLRTTVGLIVALALAGTPASAWPQDPQPVKMMSADAHPVFEVAAVKHSDPNSGIHRFHMEGRHFKIEYQTVKRLMMFAYGVNKGQIVGEPEWANSEWFDVDGVPDVEGEPSMKQAQEMVRRLLTDRFGLRFHREQRDMAIYALIVAKGGSKLKKTQSAPNSLPDQSGGNNSGVRRMKFTNNSMEEFALGMQFMVDRPVVDKTGLPGKWDFDLVWTYDDTRLTDPDAPPGLFTAVQEQLGLRLDAVKAPVDVLVVDTVERPSAN